MKKVGFGTRPSQLKARGKKIEFENEAVCEPSARTAAGRKTKQSSSKILPLAGTAAGMVALGVLLFAFFSNPSLESVEFRSSGKTLTVRTGETFSVNYADGLIYEQVRLTGLHRFLPADDVLFQVAGINKPVPAGEDVVLFLKPEEKKEYEALISRRGRLLGKLSFQLMMNAEGWIKRAESADDASVRKSCYQKAIALDANSENAHVALARLYESEKKLKSASIEYEAVIKLNPKNVAALKALKALYLKRGVQRRLVYIYEKLGNADTLNAADHYYQGGVLAEKIAAKSSAYTLYRKALGADRKHVDARQRLIKLYERDRQWKRAAANTRVLLEFDPKNPDLYLYLSDMYLRLNSKKRAAEYAQKAEKLRPGNAAICLQLALIYEKGKDYDKAIKYYRKSIRLNKKNHAAHNNLGFLLEKKGQLKDAVSSYKSAVALKPKNTDYLINLADAYEKNKQWANAVKTYEKVVKIDKKKKAAWEAIASIACDRLNNKWKGVEAYLALSRIEPKKIIWHQKAAILFEQLGKLAKAKKQYAAILEIDPNNKTARKKYVEISKKAISNSI